MANIRMNKAARDKAVVLFFLTNCRWIKNEIINNLSTAETGYGNNNCNYDNDNCYTNGSGHL